MTNYTVKSVVEDTYCLQTGRKISSTTSRTITQIKQILLQLGVKFDQHGNAPEYSKITRLVRQGTSLNEAIAQTFS
tara:strand:+ start:254 stop:481 length:228 start_codon:yes stop_codon:yes gene_type:complete